METEPKGKGWRGLGISMAFASLLPLILGLYKMFAYENGSYSWSKQVNVYVGGDAYNYIINANYATGYFVLAGILILGAIGCGVLWYLAAIRNTVEKKPDVAPSIPQQSN